ncbi:cell surface protein [Lactococcus cremoris]|uniref:cell surface protein n=1 Tax=Lactococcus lactis subsp. cremoris TaxID=1359 RepID=UPI001E4C005A|nr:cell surface protein [Lactococcus cremoris]MCD6633330.1 cell surface protein [Lactococcus cremoris]
MKKLVLIVLLLFSLSILLVDKSSADTTSYDTKGQVGFTGNWVGPESSSSSQENPKKDLPITQTILPKTGDMEFSSMLTSYVGLLILASIIVYKKERGRLTL